MKWMIVVVLFLVSVSGCATSARLCNSDGCEGAMSGWRPGKRIRETRFAQRLRKRRSERRASCEQPASIYVAAAQSSDVGPRPGSPAASSPDANSGQQILRNIARLIENPNALVQYAVPVTVVSETHDPLEGMSAYHRALFGEDDYAQTPETTLQVINSPDNLAAIELELKNAIQANLAGANGKNSDGWLQLGSLTDLPTKGVACFGAQGGTCVWVSDKSVIQFNKLINAVHTHSRVSPEIARQFVAMHAEKFSPTGAPASQPTQFAKVRTPRRQPVETQSLYAEAYQSASHDAYRKLTTQATMRDASHAPAVNAYTTLSRSQIDWNKFEKGFQPNLPLHSDERLNQADSSERYAQRKLPASRPAKFHRPEDAPQQRVAERIEDSAPATESGSSPEFKRVRRMSHSQSDSPENVEPGFDFEAYELDETDADTESCGPTLNSSAADHSSQLRLSRIR